MRGFSLYNAIAPVIVLNAKDSPRGRLFTLLHEFAHLLLRADGLCDRHDAPGQEGSDPEVFSNRVAAVTLVPEAALLADPTVQALHRSEIDDTDTQRIARPFSVSREVVLRRLLTVGKISLAYYRKKRDEYLKAYGRETQQGSPPYHILVVRNLGKEFGRTVLDAYRQELITSAALSEFLGVKLKTVPRIEEAALHHEGSGTS
jgi:Zn-dependent peptidase ImmA (M78 family)